MQPAAGDAIDVFDMTAVINEVTEAKIKKSEAGQNFEIFEKLEELNETQPSHRSPVNYLEPQEPSTTQGKSQMEPFVTHRVTHGRKASLSIK